MPQCRMYEDLKKQIEEAARNNSKIGMFHFLVLRHARELADVNAEAFCKSVNVPETYKTEFLKMIKLAKIIEEQGVTFSS